MTGSDFSLVKPATQDNLGKTHRPSFFLYMRLTEHPDP